jgi:hypothetical protein
VALLVEDIALDVDLQADVSQAEPARQRAHADQTAAGVRLLRTVHGTATTSYSRSSSTTPLARPGALGHEDHRVAAFTRLSQVRHPLVHPAVELRRRLLRT